MLLHLFLIMLPPPTLRRCGADGGRILAGTSGAALCAALSLPLRAVGTSLLKNTARIAARGWTERTVMAMDTKILDVTCGSRTMWFNKNHPAAIYTDKRAEELKDVWKSGNGQSERHCVIAPDVRCDFTDLPFEDNSFALVVFDPPTFAKSERMHGLQKSMAGLMMIGRKCSMPGSRSVCAFSSRMEY